MWPLVLSSHIPKGSLDLAVDCLGLGLQSIPLTACSNLLLLVVWNWYAPFCFRHYNVHPEYEESGIMTFNEERCACVMSVQKQASSSILSTSLYARMKEKPMQVSIKV